MFRRNYSRRYDRPVPRSTRLCRFIYQEISWEKSVDDPAREESLESRLSRVPSIPSISLRCNRRRGCLNTCLDPTWNRSKFSEAVDKVADRLLGPFNIEMLVRPINLKISEAIMNFQENSHDVSQRVFTGCGRPVLGRRRRRDNRELELESLNFDQDTLTEDRASTAAILDKLVKETRQRVRDSRQFWVLLPYKLCNDGLVVPPSNTKECWNGTHVDK